MRRAFSLLAVLAFGVIFAGLVGGYDERQALSALAVHYLTQVPSDLGAPNVVTGILITFRGFDTLGEVAVLFMVAASVGLLLASETDEKARPRVAPGAGGAERAGAQRRGKWCFL